MYEIRYYRLFSLLREKGYPPNKIGNLLGLDPADFARIETHRVVDPFVLSRICLLLQCDLDSILETCRERKPAFFINYRLLNSHSYLVHPKRSRRIAELEEEAARQAHVDRRRKPTATTAP